MVVIVERFEQKGIIVRILGIFQSEEESVCKSSDEHQIGTDLNTFSGGVVLQRCIVFDGIALVDLLQFKAWDVPFVRET